MIYQVVGEVKRAREIWPDKVFRARSSKNSKYVWQACIDCGKQRWTPYLPTGNIARTKRCRHCQSQRSTRIRNQRYGEEHPRWKGGRVKTRGYIKVWLSPDDFFSPMRDKRGYVLEHRLGLAKHLGRCLQPWEVVHHKNHIRDDNRLDNLQLTSDLGNRQIRFFEVKVNHLLEQNKQLVTEIRLLRLEIKQLREVANVNS